MIKSGFKQGFTLVEIMAVLAIVALLGAIAIPALLRSKIATNDALAQSTLKAISSAMETYATSNNSNYPTSETALITAAPPYQSRYYCGQTVSGYTYTCSFTSAAYTITATPIASTIGSTTYTLATGGVLTP